MDRIIKENLKRRLNDSSAFRGKDCPSEELLLKYLNNELPEHRIIKIREHVGGCIFCIESISSIQRWNDQKILSEFLDVPSKSLEAMKKKVCKDKEGILERLKRQKWLILSMAAFGASFLVKRYFFQFLFAALIFGIKWAVDSANKKAFVMVYRAWKDKNKVEKDKESSDERIKL